MKLNCDLGESFGAWKMGMDQAVMPLIDMANVACGFHASDPLTMFDTVRLAKQYNVEIGAHPAYPDRVGFGRRSMKCTKEELESMIWYQIGALEGVCRANGTQVTYVKPHGALNNDMMNDLGLLSTVMQATKAYGGLKLMIPISRSYPEHLKMAEQLGLSLVLEAFADRAYTDEGLLVPRSEPESVYHQSAEIVGQALSFARDGGVYSRTGKWLDLPAASLCFHGDNDSSLQAAREIKDALSSLK